MTRKTTAELLAEHDGPDPFASYRDLLLEAMPKATAQLWPTKTGNDYSAYKTRPVTFAKEVLGMQYIPSQVATVRALHKHKKVQLIGARKNGKTRGLAAIICEFMSTAPTMVISTAPTGRQVKEKLWAEIRKLVASSQRKLLGKCGVVSWRIAPGWDAIGFATDDPDNVLGFHADSKPPWETAEGSRLLFVFDDAVGIDQSIYDAIQGSFASGEVYILIAANPLREQEDPHFFAKINRDGSGFYRIHTSGADPAEYGQEHDVLADECFHEQPDWLVTKTWIDEKAREWGTGSPLFRAHCLGIFSKPGSSQQLVVAQSMLDAAERVNAQSEQGRHIGVDVARMGADEIIAVLTIDGVMAARHEWSKTKLMKTAEIIAALSAEWGESKGDPVPARNIHIDATGLGSGVTDRLEQMGLWCDPVDFGAGAEGDWPELFGEIHAQNRRAELHWIARRHLEECNGHIPAEFESCRRQATWARYTMEQEGRTGSTLKIEKKEKIRSRHGRSPDEWDAYMLTWSRSGGLQPYVGVL
ncbi:MAG: hypothetical protein GXP55_12975 [Deltaproteobacteria bacterium]|nr:hypothetical protein [Deltaproteobacteria bacterium]